jgi:uncharacterized protein with PQ loop repeat
MDFTTEYLPYVGGLCFCIHSIPQLHKVFKTKSANYISYLSLLSLAGGLSSTLLLSVQNDDPLLYVPYGIGLINVNILIFMKQYYDDGMLLKTIKTLPRNNLNQVNNANGSDSYSSNDDESIEESSTYNNNMFKASNTDDMLSNIQINLKQTPIDVNHTHVTTKSEKEKSENVTI